MKLPIAILLTAVLMPASALAQGRLVIHVNDDDVTLAEGAQAGLAVTDVVVVVCGTHRDAAASATVLEEEIPSDDLTDEEVAALDPGCQDAQVLAGALPQPETLEDGQAIEIVVNDASGEPLVSGEVTIPVAAADDADDPDADDPDADDPDADDPDDSPRALRPCTDDRPTDAEGEAGARLLGWSESQSRQAVTSGAYDGTTVIVLGPDGHLIGDLPADRRETHRLAVLLYRADKAPERDEPAPTYTVNVSGCHDVPTLRIRGEESPRDFEEQAESTDPPLLPTLVFSGHCSADDPVTITVSVPDLGSYCAAGPAVTSVQTIPVNHITVGMGVAVYPGTRPAVGLDPGTGGNAGRVFERDEAIGAVAHAMILVQPTGVSPGYPGGWSDALWQRFSFGTAVQVDAPLSRLNLLVAFELLEGLALFVGYDFARNERRLAGGLTDGDTYVGDSSTVPTEEEWTWFPDFHGGAGSGFFFGATVTLQLLTTLQKLL